MNDDKPVLSDPTSDSLNECIQVNLRITTNNNQGGRKYMEDAHAISLQRVDQSNKESPISFAYFGIFDGHGGKEAAEFARQNLCKHIIEQDEFWSNNPDEDENDQLILEAIRKGFLACHNDMWNYVNKWAKTSSGLPSTSGCTASVAFIRKNKLYIGHVGDSAIVLAESDSLYTSWKATRLTHDHKPEDPSEFKRIQESGGHVLCKSGVHRVVWNRQKLTSHSSQHHRHRHSTTTTTTTTTTAASSSTIEYEQIPFLAVSRALGDLWSLNRQTNLYAVSPEPDLSVIKIDPDKHRCIILASDGLWNMITPENAVDIVRHCDLKSNDDDHRSFRNPSQELVQRALNCWRERMLRSDNITCITAMLDSPERSFNDATSGRSKSLAYSTSSSTASICSDDTVDLDNLTPIGISSSINSSSMLAKRTKPALLRKEYILTPISNGPSPVRSFKRPASDESLSDHVEQTRQKILKTNPQKENGQTSSSDTIESAESDTNGNASSSSNTFARFQASTTDDDLQLSISEDNNDDLNRKVEECLKNHLDEMSDDSSNDQLSQAGVVNKDSIISIERSFSKRQRSTSMMCTDKVSVVIISRRRNSFSHVR